MQPTKKEADYQDNLNKYENIQLEICLGLKCELGNHGWNDTESQKHREKQQTTFIGWKRMIKNLNFNRQEKWI